MTALIPSFVFRFGDIDPRISGAEILRIISECQTCFNLFLNTDPLDITHIVVGTRDTLEICFE